ncbi:DNA repair protein RAD5A [Colletotrichum spaethianum]|uniref:DNA repair protein RAD5A n=1 Tax=Colletotrichum spaethianum TaxID=700344 RepID=A0AA37UL50_9PEZI|nr:DNA repair protein RAD5A [Colletotrichum spaethianum]GKT51136.1 DNA repair protein RAD5A [Colletotrichum spaethianum]
MARAVCALDSVSRWAVTGTPIQNHLNDLAALLRFLSVYPYNEKRGFDADISHLWKAGNADEAVKRLKRLAGCILLRRPKGTVELLPRHDQACYVEFSHAERELYDQVRTKTIARVDEALVQSNNGDRTVSFVNVLQQIEAMRMVCNVGLLYSSRHDASNLPGKKLSPANWFQNAQSSFNIRSEMGSIQCHNCPFIFDATCHPLDEPQTDKAIFARCLRFICSGCVKGASRQITIIRCGHSPQCPMAPVSTSVVSLEAPPVQISLGNAARSAYRPTKVMALIEDLQRLPGSSKWYVYILGEYVVFSTWRMTLDVVETALDQADIPRSRFDGKVPQKERHVVIDRFRHDPSIRVLLLTVSCGAVGNPTIEDQALARVHRIGQKQEVTTVRFYVRESFEEVDFLDISDTSILSHNRPNT